MTEPRPPIKFQILGPLSATAPDGTRLLLRGISQRRLLTALLLNANSVVSADRLGDWCNLSPGGLRTVVSRLRSIIGADTIVQESPGYVLRTDSIDSHEFERLVHEARSARPGEALARLDSALALWTGDALVDFADEPWAQATAISLAELRASAVEDRADILLGLGRWSDAVVAMELHIPQYPLRDRPVRLLMRALAADGRQAEALRSYQTHREYLAEEIGTEPTDAVRELEAKIATGWHDLAPTVLRPADVIHGAPGNLGAQATSFVGRDTEVKEVSELVRQHRLVTLTGVGGVGKTRLAVRVAAEVAPEFDDGVWLVELAPVGDPSAVADVVATALGVTIQAGMSVAASVADALRGRRLLLMLDSCEHVLDAVASLIEAILKESTTASIIATSREGMRAGGEHLWPVPSLGVDEGVDSAAVQLFVERAQAVNPGFSLHGHGGVEAVIEICRRLDGIALAIELAAARMVSMNPVEVAARLNDRFRLLSGSRRGLERHQTLRQAVQWSYDLLTPDEQVVLGVCAVFAGGFDLAAVTAVSEVPERIDEYIIIDRLDSLVRKSLVATKQIGGRTRYWLLETIRHFAEDRHAASAAGNDSSGAAEIDEIRDRHGRYFAAQAVSRFEIWNGSRMTEASDWVEIEFDNLRAGLHWAIDSGDLATATAIAAHTPMIAFGLQRLEPVGWAEELLPAASAAQVSQLPRLYTAASLCSYMGRPEDALRYAQAATALQADPDYQPFDNAWASFREAVAHLDAGRPGRYVEICTELAAQPALAHVVGQCGLVAFLPSVGRAADAMAIAEDAMDAALSYGHPYWIAFAHVGYGRAFVQTDPERALDMLREGLAYAREHPIPYWEAVLAREAGGLEAVHGDPERALALLSASLESFHQAGNAATPAWTLASLAVLFDRTGHLEIAATLYGATSRYPIADLILGLAAAVEHLRDTLGTSQFDDCVLTGAAMDLAEAVHYATHQVQKTRRQVPSAVNDGFDSED